MGFPVFLFDIDRKTAPPQVNVYLRNITHFHFDIDKLCKILGFLPWSKSWSKRMEVCLLGYGRRESG